MSRGGEGNSGSSYQCTQSFQLLAATVDTTSSPNRQDESDTAILMTVSALEEIIASCLLSVTDTSGDGKELDVVKKNNEEEEDHNINLDVVEEVDDEEEDVVEDNEEEEDHNINLDVVGEVDDEEEDVVEDNEEEEEEDHNINLDVVEEVDDEEDDNNVKVYDFNPVEIFDSEDAQFLRCWPAKQEKLRTIFGIGETSGQMKIDQQLVSVALLEPIDNTITSDSNYHEQKHNIAACCCQHPRGNWDRNENTFNDTQDHVTTTSCTNASLNIFDLTRIQDQRRGIIKSDQSYPCFDSPGRVFHLLRSILHCDKSMNSHCGGALHFASPWYQRRRGKSDVADQNVVAILVNNPDEIQSDSVCQGNDQTWDNLEKKEINELLQFRTGDAAPSYFLHSTCQLSMDFGGRLKNLSHTNKADSSDYLRKTMLFIYRPLPSRNVLSHTCFGQESSFEGCLWETYLEVVKDAGPKQPLTKPLSITKHRMVSPPYLSHTHEYPGLLDALLAKLETLRNEAQTIPQWTAWPEKNHYAGKAWSVFPLCYTFPANDLTKRKFIDKTCVHVPETTKLLQGLGPALRTALYSRLDPRSKLGVHTGWSDLANHVLRVHIPLVVPGSQRSQSKSADDGEGTKPKMNKDSFSMGLCGTWVDGCVETHDEGSIIIFDDSKVHRAFNYSEEERIVLIIDLARPRTLPEGTASGGHTDDLDAFINGF